MSYFWENLSDEELLDINLSDLGLTLDSSWCAPLVKELERELVRKGLLFKPHCWISDEWFSPEGIPGVAIPFYLLHPRLIKLERKMNAGLVEGGTPRAFLRLLRHETGHAIDHGFNLSKRRGREEQFGDIGIPYPNDYTYRPYSKNYVRHLREGYAQAHPEEDWAETFAVWLTPGENWRQKYKGWAALGKLSYMNKLMTDLKGRMPRVKSKEVIDSLADSKLTLRKYYSRKALSRRVKGRAFFGSKLKKIFNRGSGISGESLLLTNKSKLRRAVAAQTGQYQYEIEPMLKDLLKETRGSTLYYHGDVKKLETKLTTLLVEESSRFKRQGRHRIVM
jgi:hypothetical protein